ncbi:MAG: hypothetical protein PVJ02_06305 [Gemmatimonadota bacterium]|jgi:hypothetical protein
MRENISEATRKALLERAEGRCECHSPECRHHRPASRCPRGLRHGRWYAVVREKGAGERLWNLVAMCPQCYTVNQKAHRV